MLLGPASSSSLTLVANTREQICAKTGTAHPFVSVDGVAKCNIPSMFSSGLLPSTQKAKRMAEGLHSLLLPCFFPDPPRSHETMTPENVQGVA